MICAPHVHFFLDWHYRLQSRLEFTEVRLKVSRAIHGIHGRADVRKLSNGLECIFVRYINPYLVLVRALDREIVL